MRRLLIVTSAMVFLELAFFTAIAPLLPGYVHDLHLSTTQAGILSAAYSIGTFVASIPAGYVSSRFGPRRTAIGGMLGLGGASLAFGLLESAYLLDAARLIQGVAGALVWSGAMSWIIYSYPEEKRGQVIGTALGTAVAGSLLGPALGALAASAGTELVFAAIFLATLVLAALAWRIPEPSARDPQPIREVIACLLERPLVQAAILVSSPSLMFGVVDVLLPLRINALGGGHSVIAAAFIAGAAVESTLAPVSGRISDKISRRAPYIIGLAICALSMLVFAVADSLAVVIVALIVSAVGAALCFTPAMTLTSDAAEASNLHQGYAVGVTNLAWAAAQGLGGIIGASVAGATGDAAPSIAVAIILAGTIFYAYRTLAPRVAPATA
jgi:MFS family permease